MTEDEKRIFDKCVSISGLSQSEYFRDVAMGKKIYILGSKEEMKALFYEVHKLGVNTNQIAKNLNSSIYIGANEDMKKLLNDYNILLDKVMKLYDKVNQRISKKNSEDDE